LRVMGSVRFMAGRSFPALYQSALVGSASPAARQLPAGLGDDGQLVADQLADHRRREDADLLLPDPQLERVAVPQRPAPAARMEGHEAQVSGQAMGRHDYVVTLTARVEAPSS
jgi:hypothetical protein